MTCRTPCHPNPESDPSIHRETITMLQALVHVSIRPEHRRATLAALIVAAYAPSAWPQAAPDATAATAHTPSVLIVARKDREGYVAPIAAGGKEPRPALEIPNSVSVITQQRIEEQNLVTVADALNQVTGVTVISNDSTQSQYLSRGYALAVTNDGIPSYSAFSGYQQLDLSVYDRIEILRGPAGLFQGVGDPGGVVNVVRKRARDNFGVAGSVSTGSWDNYRGVADVTGPLNQDKTLRGRAVVSAQDRQYFYDRAQNTRYVGYGTIEWDIAPTTTVSVAATYQDDRTKSPYMGLPALTTGGLLHVDRSTSPYPDWTQYLWETKDLVVEVEHRFANQWQAKVKFDQRNQRFYFKDSYPSTGVDPATNTLNYARRVRDYRYDRDAVDLYLSGPFSWFGRRHEALVGYNFDRFAYDYAGVTATPLTGVSFGRTDLVPNFDLPYNLGGASQTTQKGLYGQVRLNVVAPLTVILGARVSDFAAKSRNVAPATPTAWAAGAKASDEITPNAGLVYKLSPEVALYGSYADIFIPTSSLKANGQPLDPRRGKQYELGGKSELLQGRLNASLAVFNLRDKNRAFADTANPGTFLNAGEVESKGWETEVSGSPAPGWQLQAGYTRLDTVYLKDKNNEGLPFDTWEPRHTLKLWGTRKFGEGVLAGLTLGLGANAVSASQAGTGTSAVRSQGGYSVWNAYASYDINRNLALAANVNNVFDATYYTRLGGLNTYNTYGDPRNLAVTLRARY
jgi:outer membrane receptor for ferric coprogen and ferric-rhodotorulic acid